MAGKEHWIKSAIRRPGSLTRYAKQKGTTVAKLVASPPKGASPLLKRRINLARTLRGLRKKKRAG